MSSMGAWGWQIVVTALYQSTCTALLYKTRQLADPPDANSTKDTYTYNDTYTYTHLLSDIGDTLVVYNILARG